MPYDPEATRPDDLDQDDDLHDKTTYSIVGVAGWGASRKNDNV